MKWSKFLTASATRFLKCFPKCEKEKVQKIKGANHWPTFLTFFSYWLLKGLSIAILKPANWSNRSHFHCSPNGHDFFVNFTFTQCTPSNLYIKVRNRVGLMHTISCFLEKNRFLSQSQRRNFRKLSTFCRKARSSYSYRNLIEYIVVKKETY